MANKAHLPNSALKQQCIYILFVEYLFGKPDLTVRRCLLPSLSGVRNKWPSDYHRCLRQSDRNVLKNYPYRIPVSQKPVRVLSAGNRAAGSTFLPMQ